jgi:choline dehydrogenase-like flavoprotein
MSASQRSACVVGAGAAGLIVADALARAGWHITLLDGGLENPALELEDTYRVQVLGAPHRGVHEGRFRSWGGSTTRWGGQLREWERHELEPRPYLGLDGWPIPFDDIIPYFRHAFARLGVPDGTISPKVAARHGVVVPPLNADEFVLRFSMWLPWRMRNLGRSVGKWLRRNPNVEILLGTTALGILWEGAGTKARGLRLRRIDGSEGTLLADVVIIAAGAIESVRLLFASRQGAQATGCRSAWLGRAFMDHLSVRVGPFQPRDRRVFQRMFSPIFVGGVQHTPRVLLASRVLERERLLGVFAHWEPLLPSDSSLLVIRKLLRSVQSGRLSAMSREDLQSLAAGARNVWELGVGYAARRRRYFPREAAIYLRVDAEQKPDPESRISVTGEFDSLGLPRLALDWKISELERRTVGRATELLAQEFSERRIGTLLDAPDPFSSAVQWGEAKTDAFHMMGGTRMARSPADGVVDEQLRVFGTENVYVASTSVFPTGGTANPTLMLIALALRLADQVAANR